MTERLTEPSVAEQLAAVVAGTTGRGLTPAVEAKCRDLLVDIVGLCVAARNTDYVASTLAGCDDDGPCTVIGHDRRLTAASAALVNGTAAHGEDFDDTFEGGPVHAGAVIVPAVLAACERHNPDGRAALLGIAAGVEVMCRLSMVVPKAIHKAGFHPTAVLGAVAAAVGVGTALKVSEREAVNAMGVAGSMAAGIIEYLAEGAWTKRMHPGWAAQSGLRAVLLARAGFMGPRTVFEGTHGLFNGFAHKADGDFAKALAGWDGPWVIETLAFKPYPCGTMIQPYIDCARRLAASGVHADAIESIECETAEGIVHRLWEPLGDKQRPPNGYAGKFATPYCIAAAFLHGNVGLDAFTDAAVHDLSVQALASKVSYRIDPNNPYPNAFTGHIRLTLRDGRTIEERQPHMRGGAHEPLTRADIEEKFRLNCRHGGWDDARINAALALLNRLFDGRIELSALRG
jgi:2-methylcitrate dehydratase PrpD